MAEGDQQPFVDSKGNYVTYLPVASSGSAAAQALQNAGWVLKSSGSQYDHWVLPGGAPSTAAEETPVESGAGGGGSYYGTTPDAGASISDMLNAAIDAIPRMSEAEWQAMAKYEPLRAQLAMDLAKQFLPQQMALQLATSEQYQPLFQQLFEKMRTRDRMADMTDVLQGAQLMQPIREAAENPAVTRIRKVLMGQIGQELAMGSRLTPAQAREVEQAVRSAELARGISGGTSSAGREAIRAGLEGQSLLERRQQKASSFITNEAAQTGDPFAAILSRPATAMGAAQNAQAAGLPQVNQTGTPVNGTSGALSVLGLGLSKYGTDVNAQTAAQQMQNQYSLGMSQLDLNRQMYENQLAAMQQWMPALMG